VVDSGEKEAHALVVPFALAGWIIQKKCSCAWAAAPGKTKWVSDYRVKGQTRKSDELCVKRDGEHVEGELARLMQAHVLALLR
jgi:hypothetical protein